MGNASYTTVDAMKDKGLLNISGSTENERLRRLIEAVTETIDGLTRRHFSIITATRYFSGNGKTKILLPDWDIVAVTSLKEDDVEDGTYNVTWSSSDYYLLPYDADPTGKTPTSEPYTALEVNLRSNGDQDVFLKGQRNYELIARFGYREWLDDTGADVSSSVAIESSATTFKTGAAGATPSTKVEIGATIKIDSEQMYVTDRDSGSSGSITVIRGVNGTTVSSHAISSDIQVYRYPRAIEEAVEEHATRLWTRRARGFIDVIGMEESGQVRMIGRGVDPDVKAMIRPYVRMVA